VLQHKREETDKDAEIRETTQKVLAEIPEAEKALLASVAAKETPWWLMDAEQREKEKEKTLEAAETLITEIKADQTKLAELSTIDAKLAITPIQTKHPLASQALHYVAFVMGYILISLWWVLSRLEGTGRAIVWGVEKATDSGLELSQTAIDSMQTRFRVRRISSPTPVPLPEERFK